MAEEHKWAGNLTLENATTPHGFQSLAAAALSSLRKYGKCYFYVDGEGGIRCKDPVREVALVDAPVVLASPSAIREVDEEKGEVRIATAELQLLDYGALVLDEPETLYEEEEEL